MEDVTLGRLQYCTFEQMTNLWNEGFKGYYSDMSQSTQGLLSKLVSQHIRPDLSIVAYAGNQPIGFVFLAVKTVQGKKLAWNGGSGLATAYRGKGIGKRMMVEAERVMREQGVSSAYLEVVSKNESAIGSYLAGGFQVVDTLIGMKREGVLHPQAFQLSLDQNINIRNVSPIEIANLSFYRDEAAWLCQWHNNQNQLSAIAYTADDEPIGYVLYKLEQDLYGNYKSIVLLQCEVNPEYVDGFTVYRSLMSHVFTPKNVPPSVVHKVSDVSISDSIKKEILEQAGFVELHEQYLMAIRF